MAKNERKKNGKAKKQPAASKHAGKWSTANEDRKRAETGDNKRTNKTTAELGAKIYACLVEDCDLTFDRWSVATRHMREKCTVGELQGRPSIDLSRIKGNALLNEGKAQAKTYPKPTEEDLTKAIKEFHKEDKEHFKHVLHRVVRKTWGPGQFDDFGFGTWAEFCKAHGFPHE